MNLDELRNGLTSLTDEMEPFEGNVRALHRRERRRRIAVSLIAAVVVVAIVVATVAITRGKSGKIQVASIPSKEVSSDRITHIDAIVVPASAAVKEVLDRSSLVARYALIPAADRSGPSLSLMTTQPVMSALCKLQTSDGYAIDAVTPGPNFENGLARALAGAASVTVTDQYSTDAEVFLQVGIAREYSMAIQGRLASDPDVQSFEYVSTTDAYEIFKRDFADQPALVQSTKPSDLPESFRITVKPGHSVAVVVDRYGHQDGVDTTITPSLTALFDPSGIVHGPGKRISPCVKP